MKKLLLVLIAMVLCVGIVTGCTQKTEDEKKLGAIPKNELKIGVLYIGPIGDGGYTYAHEEGIRKMIADIGLDDSQVIRVENVPDGDETCKDSMQNLIEEGCNVLIGTSYGYGKYMLEMANDNPNVYFMHCSGEYMNDTNMSKFFGRMYQARFLSGIAAGMKTETNKIGYVAAVKIPEVIRGIDAFTLGVRSVNPTATVEVRWTNSWYDPAKEKETAEALLAEGCDVLSQHVDSDAAALAAEQNGKYIVGYDSDMTSVAPNAFLTAPIWHWEVYYKEQIQNIIDGTWVPSDYWKGLEVGIVDLAPFSNLAPGTEEKIEEYRDKMIDGTFDVFSNYEIKDQDGNIKVTEGTTLSDPEKLNMDWFVEGVIGSPK
jgi:basic membrane protein A